MSDPMRSLLTKYAADGVEVSIRFRGDFMASGGPSGGPGKIIRVDDDGTPHEDDDPKYPTPHLGGLFQLTMPVMAGRAGQQPQQGEMPIIFSANDVLWVSTGIKIAEQPQISTPGGRRSAGGIVVPGA